MSVLIINDVPIECINQAAVTYHVPATVIISVLKAENGHVGDARRNKNGSIDYGPMQINSLWLPKIRPYGYTEQSLQHNPCANVAVGTWILAQQILLSKDYWRGVGNYHSHDATRNANYQYKVGSIYSLLTRYLNAPTNMA